MFFVEAFSFKEDEEGESEVVTTTQTEEQTEEEEVLHCFNCGNDITSKRQKIAIRDAHEHTFVNPGGYVFHIGCFREASGCVQAGESTEENTWFPGYIWNYALCASCFAHLGWMYHSADEETFYGLILDRLVPF
jgi:hypothetical protein